jgi:hypothetical protein
MSYVNINSNGNVTILNANPNGLNITVKKLGDNNYNTVSITVQLLIDKYQPVIYTNFNTIRKTFKTDNSFNVLESYNVTLDTPILPLQYSSLNEEFVKINTEGIVSLIKSSPLTEHTLRIQQQETNNYKQSIANLGLFIDRKDPIINTPILNVTKQEGEQSFNIEITSENDELPLVYETTNSNVITVTTNGTVNIISDGSANIIVSQNTSTNYNGINNIIIPVLIINNSQENPLKIDTPSELTFSLSQSKSTFVALDIKEIIIMPTTSIKRFMNETKTNKRFTSNTKSRIRVRKT